MGILACEDRERKGSSTGGDPFSFMSSTESSFHQLPPGLCSEVEPAGGDPAVVDKGIERSPL